MSLPLSKLLVERAASRYRASGRMAYKWVQGKLGGDPLFMGMLRNSLFRDGESVLDLGCGKGLLAAWLLAASDQYALGGWSQDLPVPPRDLRLRGVELLAADVAHANLALGPKVDIRCGDVRSEGLADADVIVLVDVLHYIDRAAQEELLRRVYAARRPGDRLLLRVGDAAAGWGFRWSTWVDKVVVFARYRVRCELWCRPMTEWVALLESLGFAVKQLPMSEGTQFANVLLIAERVA